MQPLPAGPGSPPQLRHENTEVLIASSQGDRRHCDSPRVSTGGSLSWITRESGGGPPHSRTLRAVGVRCRVRGSVLECASPLALSKNLPCAQCACDIRPDPLDAYATVHSPRYS